MSRFFAFPAGRRAKWVVLFAWILAIVLMLGLNLPGKYSDAEKNESTSFLPGDAESTKALTATEALQDGEQAPTVIVYQRDGKLTRADQARIGQDARKLDAANAPFRNASPFGKPTVSKDGSTALVVNSLTATGSGDDIIDPVEKYRELVSGEQDGLRVQVGGPAGISADAIKVFEGINGTLLLAAVALVFVLLILIYRSPFFWFFPLLAVILAEISSRAFGYGLTEIGVTVNGQSSSIGSILVLGAGTDYALLLVSRYREELAKHEDVHEAMALALRAAGPAILASGLTVSITLMSLTFAKVNGTAGLGPTGAVGILVALLAMLTFLPAVLTIVGRRPFWPFVPRYVGPEASVPHGAFQRLGERVQRSPRRVWVGTAAVLGVFCLGLLNFSDGLTQGDTFRDTVESITAQDAIAKAFPAGQSAPTDVVVKDPAKVEAVVAAVGKVPGVAQAVPTRASGPEGTLVSAFLREPPYSTAAFEVIPRLRTAVRAVDPGALVGGPTAVETDLRDASGDDTRLLVPVATLIVFLILMLLLRAVLVSVLLIATVILSFAASLGVAAVVYDVVFGFPGSDPSLPLFAFIFLVALGVDYNIFLMARVREEVAKGSTRPGMLKGLAVTGGVITSAGIVLAGTFSVLAVLPLVFLTEIGFVIAFGVLLDTFIVRSILVPALVFDLGPKVWWPSKLAHESAPAEPVPGSVRAP